MASLSEAGSNSEDGSSMPSDLREKQAWYTRQFFTKVGSKNGGNILKADTMFEDGPGTKDMLEMVFGDRDQVSVEDFLASKPGTYMQSSDAWDRGKMLDLICTYNKNIKDQRDYQWPSWVEKARRDCMNGSINIKSKARILKDTLILMEPFIGVHIPLLSTLSDAEREEIARLMKRNVYKKGDQIIKQGEEGDEFFIIETGEGISSFFFYFFFLS